IDCAPGMVNQIEPSLAAATENGRAFGAGTSISKMACAVAMQGIHARTKNIRRIRMLIQVIDARRVLNVSRLGSLHCVSQHKGSDGSSASHERRLAGKTRRDGETSHRRAASSDAAA